MKSSGYLRKAEEPTVRTGYAVCCGRVVATQKKECIHFRQFTTRDELRQMVFSWIESFYNNRRVQARLGYMSPREYASWLMSGKQAA
jgi:transposase InsO family protein